MAQLTCENLSLGYEGKTIIENLNFQINQGDYLCILGENGAGKSTLMKGILSLKKPMAGSLKWADDIKSTEIGYLTQQSEIQKDFPASVYEIVISGCQSRAGLRPFYNKAEKDLAEQAMEKMKITQFRKRCYRELSGGQQQRVMLARALCATQKILFLDEPVAGLDQNVSTELYDVVHQLNHKYGITVVMISHDIEMAMGYASHILHIGNGNFYGTKEEYLQNEASKTFRTGICTCELGGDK